MATKTLTLEDIAASAKQHVESWKQSGKKTTHYNCPYCKSTIEVCQPGRGDVSSKGYWDTAKICIECGEVSFLVTWPNGKTKAVKIGE